MTTPSKLILSWSSGKDSAWTLQALRAEGSWEIGALLTTMNDQAARVAMHAVRLELLEAQARSAGLPLWQVPLPHRCSNEVYEQRFGEAVARATAAGFTHIAFGDLFLEDVRRYREERLAGTGLHPVFPLWHQPTDRLAREMVAGGLRATLTSIDPRVLHRSFAGRAFDSALLEALPATVDPCGERGEFHTFAHAGPMFEHDLAVELGEIVERDGFVFADVLTGRASP